jgi:uncharacterized membrane protein
MFARLRFKVSKASRGIWFRPVISVLASIAAVAASLLLGPVVPPTVARALGADGVDRILEILASGMLAVAIFSLTTMVAAMQAASEGATPRVRALLIEDRTAQNAISTFIGAFLFSLLAIAALSAGFYDVSERFVLLVFTLCLIAVVVITLIRWIQALSHIGGVDEAVDRTERATRAAIAAARPTHGRTRPDAATPDGHAVHADAIGFVQHVDERKLADAAERLDTELHVIAGFGAYVDPKAILAVLADEPDENARHAIRSAFIIGTERSFDRDPRYGLCVLSEIASRALSPAVNDPGTAMDVLTTLTRILVTWRDAERRAPPDEVRCPRLSLPPIEPREMVGDSFRAIARDGAGMVEVQVRLQKVLATLAAVDPLLFGDAARDMSAEALMRARRAMPHASDVARVDAAAARVGGAM